MPVSDLNDDTKAALGAAFARYRAEVHAIISRAERQSEAGVVETGKALGAIVSESRAQAADFELLAGAIAQDSRAGQSNIGAAIAAQSDDVSQFADALVAKAGEQSQIASRAATLTSGIVLLARDIHRISAQSKLLSLNARIECARLGDQGKALQAVASEMASMSASIVRANAEIEDFAATLTKLLPAVAELSDQVRTESESFSSRQAQHQKRTQSAFTELLDQVRRSVESSQWRVETILKHSHEALSALQFQDPMVQSLYKIPHVMDELLRELDSGSNEADSALDSEPPGEPAAAPGDASSGEILLF